MVEFGGADETGKPLVSLAVLGGLAKNPISATVFKYSQQKQKTR